MDYFDFDLLLERSDNAYLARVVSSPAGQAETVFPFPFDDKDLEIFNLKVGQPRKGVRRVNSPEMELAQEYGTRLFKAVFGGEVYTSFRSSHDQARREGKGLRLQLRIKDQRLAGLPWEYLYNPSLHRFLSLAVDTPVVRYLDLPEPVLPFPVALPLKILAVITSPKDLPLLDVEGEWQRLNQALALPTGRGATQVDRLKIPTLSALPSQLRSGGPYHILHFVGHGTFDERSQDGLLMFENEHGTSQPVNGQRLGTILHNHPSLRLAVLNACEGAHPAAEDPFAGVAHSLVQQGLPAVVAMQFAITDRAALILAQEFYAALASGYPVDAALAEARVAIYADGNDIEWGTPVYFTRLPDGHIFDLAAALPEAPAREQAEKKSPQVPKKLAARSYDHLRRLLSTSSLALSGIAMLLLCLLLIWGAVRFGPQMIAALRPTAIPTQTISASPVVDATTQSAKPPTFTPVPTSKPTDTPSPTAYPSEITQKSAAMVLIPAGAFQMGCDPNNSAESCQDNEKPLHTVTLDTYYIDKYEVTNGLYQACVESGGCTRPSNTKSNTRSSYYNRAEFADYPVIYVSWEQARKYCAWRGARLPTEAEWEKAARGDQDTRMYPWGNQAADCERANFTGCINDTEKVGSYPKGASPYGVLDMAGNVLEWVNDWYDSGYYYISPSYNPPGPEAGQFRVLRGGGWNGDRYLIRSAYRCHYSPGDLYYVIGFRCVSPPGPNP